MNNNAMRGDDIMKKVDEMQKGKPVKKKKKRPKNPYPPGSARAKYWERRQRDKELKEEQERKE